MPRRFDCFTHIYIEIMMRNTATNKIITRKSKKTNANLNSRTVISFATNLPILIK